MQHTFCSPPYVGFQGHDYDPEMKKSAVALSKARYALARETMLMRAMEHNAQLAHHNQLLRMQMALQETHRSSGPALPPGLVPPGLDAPPGLELERPLPPRCRLSSRKSEVSTAAGSSVGMSWVNSLLASEDSDQEVDQGAEGAHTVTATSSMIRNIPNDYSRERLVEQLNAEGFAGCFDFLYLPIDFTTRSGLGYAFVNFVSHAVAERFQRHFTGFDRWSMASDKVCEVHWSSLQGLEAHVERYRNSPVMHESIPEDQKPLLFSGPYRRPFPSPTKKIRAPRHWHRRRN